MARNLLDLCNKLKEQSPILSSLQKLMETLAPGIKSSVRLDSHLLQMTVPFGSNKLSSELSRQCHGVVICCQTWTILSMLTPQFNVNCKKADILANFAEYNFYAAVDGSLMSVYWNDGLKLSTSNGHDVSAMCRFGDTSYLQALCQLLGKTEEETTAFFFPDEQSHRRCYVVCMRHHAFQLLVADPAKLILVCVYDLDTTREMECELELPRHESVPVDTANPAAEYSRLLAMCEKAFTRFTENGECFYGVIMRSKTLPIEYASCANILLESKLMTTVRKHIYDIRSRASSISPKTPQELCLFVSLRAFLNHRGAGEFARLFPALPLTEYIKLTNALNITICGLINNTPVDEQGVKFMSIARAVFTHLAPLVRGKCPNLSSIVQDQLTNPVMMVIYYNYWLHQ